MTVSLARIFQPRKPRYRLFDTQFAGQHSCSSIYKSIKPTFFSWAREGNHTSSNFYTDSSLNEIYNILGDNNIAWLVESPEVFPESIHFIKQKYHKFDFVLTHQKELLEIDDRFLFCPVGGCWIKPSQWKLYIKTKPVSLIASAKNVYEGHKLRHNVAATFGEQIDLFGRGYKTVKHKVDALKDYRYTIVIENCRSDFYFTEKLIDAFACGTVPIYWGCPSIGNFFDERGMIYFDSIGQLPEILSSLSIEDYRRRLKGIEANFFEARKYQIMEDWLWRNYKDKIFI